MDERECNFYLIGYYEDMPHMKYYVENGLIYCSKEIYIKILKIFLKMKMVH